MGQNIFSIFFNNEKILDYVVNSIEDMELSQFMQVFETREGSRAKKMNSNTDIQVQPRFIRRLYMTLISPANRS